MADGTHTSHASAGNDQIGIVLVNFGMPARATHESVAGIIKSFLSDRRVTGRIGFMVYRIFRRQRLNAVVDRVTKKYKELQAEGIFDYFEIGSHQKKMVAEELSALGVDNVVVTLAYRYSTPSMHRAFAHLSKIGCRKVLVVPLYPQSSHLFTSSVKDVMRREKLRLPRSMEFRFIEGFHKNKAYIDAIATQLLASKTLEKNDPKIVFAFRSIPLRDVRKGDTYELQTSATALAIARKAGLNRNDWTISYIPYEHQVNRSMLTPNIEETVDRFHLAKLRDLTVICPGELTDTIETLYEVDTVMRNRFEGPYEDASEGYSFTYIPALNDSPAFARVIAQVIYENLSGWVRRHTPPEV